MTGLSDGVVSRLRSVATWPEFDLVSAHYDALQVSLDLSVNAMIADAWPSDTYTPAGFPALF